MKSCGGAGRRSRCGPVLVFVSLLASSSSSLVSDVSFPDVTLSKIAFGSCHKRKYAIRTDLPPITTSSSSSTTTASSSSIWDTIAQQDPDVFLWTGDAVYPPKRGIASVELLQTEYQHMITNTSLGYANFQPRHGIYGTWDDHDYGGNDMGSDMPDKEARAKAFLDFIQKKVQPNKDDETVSSLSSSPSSGIPPHRQGVYQSIEFGVAPQKVKIILLDTRWHRSSHCIPSVATNLPLGAGIACLTRWLTAGLAPLPFCQTPPEHSMLGKEQWDWLEQELQTSTAQIHVVVSSVQVLTTNPVMESWGHYPHERRRLIQLLHNQKSGVVVLSGDVHHAEILNPNAYQYQFQQQQVVAVGSTPLPSSSSSSFLEVTSSGLTHECSKHIYGALCQPLLEIFSGHRYRESASDSSNKNDNDIQDKNKYYYIGRNYGMIQVDWEQQTFQVNVHSLETVATTKSGQPQQHDIFNQIVLTTGPRSFASSSVVVDLDADQVIPCLDGHLIPFLKRVGVTLLSLAVVSLYLWRNRLRNKQRRR